MSAQWAPAAIKEATSKAIKVATEVWTTSVRVWLLVQCATRLLGTRWTSCLILGTKQLGDLLSGLLDMIDSMSDIVDGFRLRKPSWLTGPVC
jgi:hypothetical protein